MSVAEAAGIILGAGSLLVTLVAYVRERRERRQEIGLLRRQVLGESAAEVVLFRLGSHIQGGDEPVVLSLLLRNVGPAAARNVEVDFRLPVESAPPSMWRSPRRPSRPPHPSANPHRMPL